MSTRVGTCCSAARASRGRMSSTCPAQPCSTNEKPTTSSRFENHATQLYEVYILPCLCMLSCFAGFVAYSVQRHRSSRFVRDAHGEGHQPDLQGAGVGRRPPHPLQPPPAAATQSRARKVTCSTTCSQHHTDASFVHVAGLFVGSTCARTNACTCRFKHLNIVLTSST